VAASRRKGFKRPKISHICTVLKSSRTRTKNKLIIHLSTVHFLIMHTDPNPNLKHGRSENCETWRGRGITLLSNQPMRLNSSVVLACGRTRCSATVGEEFVSGTGVFMVAGGRRPATAIGSWVRGARSIARDGDWLPNTVCI
jgi:hypothetical protein